VKTVPKVEWRDEGLTEPDLRARRGEGMAALHIEEDDEAYRLVRELADLRGESMSDVVTKLAREAIEREQVTDADEGLAQRLVQLGKKAAPLWKEPWRSTPHGDLLYDNRGLPE
jgi:antitoxin VapB